MPRKPSAETRNAAWIGDAVLALYAREWILRESGVTDGDRQRSMSSNQFLAQFGNPTEVEAVIGRIYQEQGLAAAYQWMTDNLLPRVHAQERRAARSRK
jgi:dsRNA-specific ribonuclease